MTKLKLFPIMLFVCCMGVKTACSNKTLFIEIIENKKSLQVVAALNSQNRRFMVEKSKSVFQSCIKIDQIVARTDKGDPQVLSDLNKEIDFLSKEFLAPIKDFVNQCDLLDIMVSTASVRIPFEFLKIDNELIYCKIPIIYSYTKTDSESLAKIELQSGFIVGDSTADPENACGLIAKKIPESKFHYVEDINLDTIRKTGNVDFILMSVHGGINIRSCQCTMMINREALSSSTFSQKKVKLIYFDSCHLGKGKNFADQFHSLGAEYYMGPLTSNESGYSSTKTILTYFKYLEKNNPVESLLKTKQELKAYSNGNQLVELWFAAMFRLYKLN